MSDLVERLREIANDQTYCNGLMCAAESWMEDAADRIEALEREVSYLREREKRHMDYIEELEAQVHSNQTSSMRSAKAAEKLQEKLDS